MTTKHLSEEEIQAYALDQQDCGNEIILHIEDCAACRAHVVAYIQLFSAIQAQAKPSFDFDLTGLVIQQVAKPKFSWNDMAVYISIAIAFLVTIASLFIFRKCLENMFTGILPMGIYLIVLVVIAVIFFQGAEMYRKYQKQISVLD